MEVESAQKQLAQTLVTLVHEVIVKVRHPEKRLVVLLLMTYRCWLCSLDIARRRREKLARLTAVATGRWIV